MWNPWLVSSLRMWISTVVPTGTSIRDGVKVNRSATIWTTCRSWATAFPVSASSPSAPGVTTRAIQPCHCSIKTTIPIRC